MESNYIDFSQVAATDEDAIQALLQMGTGHDTAVEQPHTNFDEGNFPVQLHHVLTEMEGDGMDHIASWAPHGRSFMVHKQGEFVELVLRRWFRQTKFTSFQRQLNIYGFHRITTGIDKGGYYHQFFLRGKIEFSQRLKRMNVKGTGPRRAGSKQDPNFYSMLYLPASSKTSGSASTSQPSLSAMVLGDARAPKPASSIMAPAATHLTEVHQAVANRGLCEALAISCAPGPSRLATHSLPVASVLPFTMDPRESLFALSNIGQPASNVAHMHPALSSRGLCEAFAMTQAPGRSILANHALPLASSRSNYGYPMTPRALTMSDVNRAVLLQDLAARRRQANEMDMLEQYMLPRQNPILLSIVQGGSDPRIQSMLAAMSDRHNQAPL